MVSRTLLSLALARGVLGQVPSPFGFTSGWWGNLPAPQTACRLATDDPASWEASGANKLVTTWLEIHGEKDWLVELNKNITSQQVSPNTLDCTKLGANTCTPPEKDCFSYNPPAHFFVRQAAARANDFFDQAYTALMATTIDNILSMDSLLGDFGGSALPNMDMQFRIASASLTVAEKVLKNIPVVGSLGGDFIGLMSATTALIGLTTGPTSIDLAKIKEDVTNQLHDIFTKTEQNLDKMNSKMLNGKGDLDLVMVMDILKSMRGSKFSDGDAHPIAKIMEGGAFLARAEAATTEGGIRAGMDTIKQGIIGSILRGMGYFVYVSEKATDEECFGRYGFQRIDGKCHGLFIQKGGGLSPAEDNIYDKAQSYGINMVGFFKNVLDCNNGEIGDENVGNGDGWQKCFFHLRSWTGQKSSPCDSDGWKNFPELRLSDDICRKKKEDVPCRNKCIRGEGWYGQEAEVEA